MCTKVYALMLMLFAVVSVYGQDNVIDEVVSVSYTHLTLPTN